MIRGRWLGVALTIALAAGCGSGSGKDRTASGGAQPAVSTGTGDGGTQPAGTTDPATSGGTAGADPGGTPATGGTATGGTTADGAGTGATTGGTTSGGAGTGTSTVSTDGTAGGTTTGSTGSAGGATGGTASTGGGTGSTSGGSTTGGTTSGGTTGTGTTGTGSTGSTGGTTTGGTTTGGTTTGGTGTGTSTGSTGGSTGGTSTGSTGSTGGSTGGTATGGTTAPALDQFGVAMVYPSKVGGESWFLNHSNPTGDGRFNPQKPITKNADGSWKMKDTQVRMLVYTTAGYGSAMEYNRDKLAARGYMQSARDWKNVELTGYVKLNAASDTSDNFTWYARGGRHNDSNQGCEGSCYKGDLHYDGRVRVAKETWHVSYDYTSYATATTALKGRWVGFKVVIRDAVVNGKTAARTELWLDDDADGLGWKKVGPGLLDDGSFGGDADHCGGSVPGMPITWGGPVATFRWDSATDVDFKWLSVREIE